MTAATLTSLPLTAGGALVGSLTRGGVWMLVRALDFGLWTAAQFMRAPLAISAIIGVAGFSLLAGSNALYFQSERHPAPLFFDSAPATAPAHEAAPVMPAPRPANLSTRIDTETTGSLGTPAPASIIGFPEVLALQQKLVALRLLNDDPDGIFGQRTAAAIRAFQKDAGLRVDGKLTPRVIAAVASAELPAAVAPPVQVAAALPPAPIPAPAVAAMAPAESPAIAALPPAAATPRPVPLAAVAAPVAPAAAPFAPPPADTFAANSLPAAPAPAQAAPPAAAAAAAPDRTMAREDLTATGSRVAMNSPRSTTPAAPASGANLSAAQRLAAQIGTLPPEATTLTASRPPVPAAGANDTEGSIDPVLISNIQRGLASLGFLSAKIDGVPGEGTAKAIRNFEVFYDYKITGLATQRLLSLLVQHGAVI